MGLSLRNLKIGDVIELVNGQKVEITTLTTTTGDTVGYRINPNSRLETTVDISGVVKVIGRCERGITYDLNGKKIDDYMYL